MDKLIEVALPLSKINAKTLAERQSVGHPANLHMWWGRSPRSSSVAALMAAMVDSGENHQELKNRLERIADGGFTAHGAKPLVFDPFAGFGGIPLAAQELGFPVIAGDLNPVAVMLTKAAAEIPSIFQNCPAVNPDAVQQEYTGAEGLAADVLYYGSRLAEKARERLKNLYPDEPEGKPAAWIWARTVKCPNPACGCRIPLASSFTICEKGENSIWMEPIAENGQIHFEARKGKCPPEKETNKYGKAGAIFRCPACGALTTDAYVKNEGKARRIGSKMMAIAVETEKGKIYKAPTPAQEHVANVSIPENIPEGAIPDNAHWFSPPGFGMTEYSDLFSPRQLTMLTTFCDLLLELQDRVAMDALAARMSPHGGSLAEHGTGALAYGQAICVYLAFVIDKLADSNSTICSWRKSGNTRNTFGRQAIPMVWTYAEGNPFSSISGNYHSALKNVVAAIRNLPCGSEVTVNQADAVLSEFPKNVLVCTEIPYYKNIGYAHLSDFFYIWLRRSLKPVFPTLFNSVVTSKEELSTADQYFEGDAQLSVQNYESKLRIVISKLYACSSTEYPALLFFEYHKADEAAITEIGSSMGKQTPWEHILDALVQAGFTVTATWPMRNEPVSEKADAVRILIVASKADKVGQITRRGFITTMKRELPEALDKMFLGGIDPCDRVLSAMGAGIAIYSRYPKILNADATEMTVHDALQVIRLEVDEYIMQHFEAAEEKEED